MRVLFINTTCGRGSHGKICTQLAQEYIDKGDECRIAYGRESVPEQYQSIAIRIGGKFSILSHVLKTRLFDRHGFGSTQATKKFLKWADKYNPDLLWLHNIHGYFINIELLFNWIKSRPNIQVKWTLHDEWAFTGHCGCFNYAGCLKWKVHCENCPQKKEYPQSWRVDNSVRNFDKKKSLFTGVHNLNLITPSKWLADLTQESFLKEYPVSVVYNTIDTRIFRPTESQFRKENGLMDKKMILCVANVWQECKGLKDVLNLQRMLNKSYVIVLVGVDSKQKTMFSTEQGRLQYLENLELKATSVQDYEVLKTDYGVAIRPSVYNLYKNITGQDFEMCPSEYAGLILIERTHNQKELAELYTAADLFINPTREDNYPTVNLEAKACGTYVITYDTGGAKETLK